MIVRIVFLAVFAFLTLLMALSGRAFFRKTQYEGDGGFGDVLLGYVCWFMALIFACFGTAILVLVARMK